MWPVPAVPPSYHDVEELLAERGMEVSYETVRRWVLKFGPLMPATGGSIAGTQAPDGTSMKWLSGLPAGACTCGAPSTTRAKS